MSVFQTKYLVDKVILRQQSKTQDELQNGWDTQTQIVHLISEQWQQMVSTLFCEGNF